MVSMLMTLHMRELCVTSSIGACLRGRGACLRQPLRCRPHSAARMLEDSLRAGNAVDGATLPPGCPGQVQLCFWRPAQAKVKAEPGKGSGASLKAEPGEEAGPKRQAKRGRSKAPARGPAANRCAAAGPCPISPLHVAGEQEGQLLVNNSAGQASSMGGWSAKARQSVDAARHLPEAQQPMAGRHAGLHALPCRLTASQSIADAAEQAVVHMEVRTQHAWQLCGRNVQGTRNM